MITHARTHTHLRARMHAHAYRWGKKLQELGDTLNTMNNLIEVAYKNGVLRGKRQVMFMFCFVSLLS